jgi:ABC-type polysaccharide/polyol phosphate transport system ATPase subunit
VEGLGKKYALHHEKSERYTALRDVVARQAKAAGRLLNPFTRGGQLRKAQLQALQERAGSEEEFWALKDVSFEIRRGERVGIIGRNGAGKSTLLKILSRITEPTTGRVEIRGRVASLLEVGTGFHPELTGRENIYLNGAILGMTRREIRSKFDEIVDFAEVEKFLDTPVKRYSSGMYVRLAFAVAAHLEPEILVVDEVLAVGDEKFQEKCLGKLEQSSSKQGITSLVVSHNMSTIARLCSSSLYLCNGQGSLSSIDQAIRNYRREGDRSKGDAIRLGPVRVRQIEIEATNVQPQSRLILSIHLVVEIEIEFVGDFEFVIRDQNGLPVAFACRHLDLTDDKAWKPCLTSLSLKAKPACMLSGGFYTVDILLVQTGSKLLAESCNAHRFEVAGPRLGKSQYAGTHQKNGRGSILIPLVSNGQA